MPSSRGSSLPRDQTQVSCIAGGFFTVWATSLSMNRLLKPDHSSWNADVAWLMDFSRFETRASHRGRMVSWKEHKLSLTFPHLKGRSSGLGEWTKFSEYGKVASHGACPMWNPQGISLLLLLLSCFSHIWLFETPEMTAHQAPPSLGFSSQEHWSGLPFPSPMHGSEKWKWSRSVVSDS